MELNIESVKENPLLDRREVKANVNHNGEPTPSKEDVKSRLAADRGLDKENIEIRGLYTGYGSNQSRAEIKVFEEFEYDEEKQEETVEDDGEDVQAEEYIEVVSGTITEVKEQLNDMEDPDYEAALQAEKENKNRTTLVDWLESQTE